MVEREDDRARRRNRLVGGGVAIVVVAVVVGAVLIVTAHAHRPPGPPAAAPVSTATVQRTNLSNSQTLPGTLGFGTASTVTGRGQGTITSLPGAGATVSRGQALYGVDGQPVALFYGGTPLYRTLTPPAPPTTPPTDTTIQGADVTVVADNLKALGYAVGAQPASATTKGDVYTASLAAAVKKWQQKIGMTPTGTLGVGQLVVYPGAVRVNGVQAQLGDSATEAVLSVTPTDKVITVPVAATDLGGIATGGAVSITLPSGQQVPGTVGSISQNVQGGGDSDPNGPPSPPTTTVTITLNDPGSVTDLASAPVQVGFTTSGVNDVLAVPVTALLALRGGGYALQLPSGKLIPVRTGLFANGEVQVSGPGVTQGLRVQTAAS